MPSFFAASSVLHSGAIPDSFALVAVIAPTLLASLIASGCANTLTATFAPPNLWSKGVIAGKIVAVSYTHLTLPTKA